jgi:hypothetical protein
MPGLVGQQGLIERPHASVVVSLQPERVIDPPAQRLGSPFGDRSVASLDAL